MAAKKRSKEKRSVSGSRNDSPNVYDFWTGLPPLFPEVQPVVSGPSLKEVLDKIGGLDGLLSSLGKMQKIMQICSQMVPSLKLMGSLFSPQAATSSITPRHEQRTRKALRGKK